MAKPGRNDPCYCGSGKKYKQCHLKIDQAAEQERRQWVEAARFLRRDLMKFARDERFAEDFTRALSLYWDDLYTIDNAEEMSQSEALRFFDWFVFDYALEDGTYLIEAYQKEKKADLSSVQQAALEKWLAVGPSGAYTLVDYDADTLWLRDFTTGETFEVAEPGGRGQVEIGEVVLGRLVPVYDHLEFSPSAAYLPHDEIADLADKLAVAKTADSVAHPNATHADFMRRHNHLLVHHALEQARLKGRPPVACLDPNRPDKTTQKVARQIRKRAA